MAESEYEKVIPTSGNAANGVSHVRGAGPQSSPQSGPQSGLQSGPQYGTQFGPQSSPQSGPRSGPQDYEVPSLNFQLQSSAVDEPVYEGIS